MTQEPRPNAVQVLDELRRAGAPKVKVAVTDLDGVLRGKYIHADKFHSAAEGGFGFCNVVFGWDSADACYDNARYTGWHTGYPDALARIDLSTYRRVPWDGNVPFFLGEFEDGAGQPLPVCPRQTLRRVLRRAAAAGFEPRCGLEFEFFNFAETPRTLADKGHTGPTPLTPGMFGYSLLRMAQNPAYFNALMDELRAFGVPLEGLHTETGPGVLEAAILFSDALEAADRGVLFKSGAREIGARFGIMPSFMAKWNAALPGCSGHTHLSFWKDGHNTFHDGAGERKMSATFEHALAGLLELLPDMLPFYAPTVNSYKRLVDGYWAPTKPTWGIDNRTVAFRVIPGGEKSTRVEVRVAGSDINPYLAIAAACASATWGIERKLALQSGPVAGSAYQVEAPRLPRTLWEATARLEQSQPARELLGEAFVDHFVATRQWEWRQFQDAVTDWEMRRYLEII